MQSRTVRTFNSYHLGDNLVHLHFMRKVALANPDRQFVHYAQNRYNWQLRWLVKDIPNLKLDDVGWMMPSDSINAWRGWQNVWYNSPIRNDFVEFHLQTWFPHLCRRMEVENPMREPKDMLFDYPAIKESSVYKGFDVLIINAPPSSGQFNDFNLRALESISERMLAKKLIVAETGTGIPKPFRTATEIGAISLHCHTILMVSTGPSWPTFNIWNQDSIKTRIILLDNERVNLAPNTTHCSKIEEAEEVLKSAGLL